MFDTMRLTDLLLVLLFEGRAALPSSRAGLSQVGARVLSESMTRYDSRIIPKSRNHASLNL